MRITRRSVLAGAGTIIGAGTLILPALANTLLAAEGAPADAGADAGALAAAAAGCVEAGNACLQHCLDLLAKGDTSLAECSQAVRQMLAICGAVGPVADARSKYLKPLARLCLDVCTDCEQACRKHEAHHAACKRCAEACAKTIDAARHFV